MAYNYVDFRGSWKLLSMYQSRVLSWARKKSVSEIVHTQEETPSFYSRDKKQISLSATAAEETLYHELGHEAYASYNGDMVINTMEFYEEAASAGNADEAKTLLDFYYEEVKQEMNRRHPISIVSDVLGMIFDTRFTGYWGHAQGYIRKNWDNDIVANEAFAELFSTIATRSIARFDFMRSYYPQFVNSCLDLIDRCSWR